MSRHNSIQSRAMLAALHISKWAATRTDKKVTEDVARKHGVNSKRAGHYRKHAIDTDHPTYKAVGTAVSSLKSRHYYWTLPWGENGARILPAANFDKYSADMRLLRADFDNAVAQFIADYPALAQKARGELGTLFDPADYPNDIKSKFGCEVSIMPLPDADDFRVDLPDEAIDEIRSNITRELQQTMTDAMREPYTRLFEYIHTLGTQVGKIGDEKGKGNGRVYDGTVEGLRGLCEILDGLNLTNDAQLSEFGKRASELIDGLSAESIREMTPGKRSEIAQQAAQIESDMAAFMGVMSPPDQS
jgi:hypothetical protein